VTLRELNVLESDLLNLLSFTLFVDVESYFRYFIQLQKYFLHLNISTTISPPPVDHPDQHSVRACGTPTIPSPCLIPPNQMRVNQSFTFPTMYADPISDTKDSSSTLRSIGWMESDEVLPWNELSQDSRDDLFAGDFAVPSGSMYLSG